MVQWMDGWVVCPHDEILQNLHMSKTSYVKIASRLGFGINLVSLHLALADVRNMLHNSRHRRTVWGVKKGGRWPQAACSGVQRLRNGHVGP
jgi:hypothetical protein